MKRIGIVLLLISFMSCHGDLNKDQIVTQEVNDDGKTVIRSFDLDSFGDKVLLDGQRFSLSDNLSMPGKLAITDDYVFVMDSKGEYPVHVIDLKKREYIKPFSSRGGGPGEVIGGYSLDVFNNSLWIYDVQLSRFLGADIDHVLSKEGTHFKTNIKIENSLSCIEPLWLSDTSFVSINLEPNQSGRFNLFSSSGVVNGSIGSLNLEKETKDPYSILLQAYQGDVELSKDKQTLVISDLYSDRIEVFNLDGDTEFVLKGPGEFDPLYEILDGPGSSLIMGMQRTTKLGYLCSYVTEKFIYGLYSGETIGSIQSNQVFVFDRFTGEPIKEILLDEEITGFAVSSDDKQLVAFILGAVPDLVSYEL